MNRTEYPFPSTRREFIKGATAGIGLLAFGSVAPRFLAQSALAGQPTPEADRSILVLIQLGGGNDGLNTLVPFEDANYYRLRPTIGIRKPDTIRLTDTIGLHPSCRPFERLFKDGQLSIVQNVGYPNPNRSHFRSMEIWETASDANEYVSTGWLGRYFDSCCPVSSPDTPTAVSVGDEMPDAFLAESDLNLFCLADARGRAAPGSNALLDALRKLPASHDGNASFLQHTIMNTLVTEQRIVERIRAYRALAAYPESNLARSLKSVAALISSGNSTRVYYVSHTGFDTHAGQLDRHGPLLEELATSMAAFQQDLTAHGLQDQVLTMTFSEFGRRPSENRSGGTDHGTAAPLFVMGSRTKGGILGTAPSLALKPNQDLAFSTDFRGVYATVIDKWLNGDSAKALGDRFDHTDFV